MDSYLTSTVAELHREDLLRAAEHQRVAMLAGPAHPWRNRMGAALIRVGRRLLDEPEPARRPRARVA
ncbi:MAG TPA: hypothetical protein VFH03_13735 [Actinoplanes sp.]|nr:hypothetical protein [Actinoplanes sp.]